MARKSKQSSSTIDPNLTLAALSAAYLANLAERGASAGTAFSYALELRTAQAVLGADTRVSDLTHHTIAAFNTSDVVMKKKNGKAKAEPSFLKTRRTLRLCLAFGEQHGLIEKSPVDALKDALPGGDATTETTTTTTKKKGKKRGALVLAVAQPEAERAADVAEAMVADNAPESAA